MPAFFCIFVSACYHTKTVSNYIISRRKIIIPFVFCFVIIALLFVEWKEVKADENFTHWFKGYFLSSQPKQVIIDATYQKPKDGQTVTVPVIVYHGVRPDYPGETAEVKRYTTEPTVFEQELLYLRDNGYHVISFDELTGYFDTGKPLPSKAVILNFDDGWESQYTYAFPLLKKYGVTGTFFVFTNAIGRAHFMTWDQLKEMDAAGMTIGGHTKTHPYLTQITDPKELEQEIGGGKKIIEEHLGKTIRYFAYPFGLYNDTTAQAVRDAGYRIGRTSSLGMSHTEESLFRMPCIYDQNSILAFKAFEKLFSE